MPVPKAGPRRDIILIASRVALKNGAVRPALSLHQHKALDATRRLLLVIFHLPAAAFSFHVAKLSNSTHHNPSH